MPVIPASMSPGQMQQASRIGQLHSPLGPETLVLSRFNGIEALNELFTFEVEALSTEANLAFDGLLGKHVTVQVETIAKGHPPRFFDGLLAGASWTGLKEGAHGYRLTLKPWLWLLTLRKNQRIFHNKTAPEILQEIFADYGFTAEFTLLGFYPTLEYTVQYGETDFDFVSRMMERFGITYGFLHSMGEHRLVLVDDNDTWQPVVGGFRDYYEMDDQNRRPVEHLTDWQADRKLTTSKVTMVDYDFKKPSADLGAEDTSSTAGHDLEVLESFEFPGLYLEKGEGKAVSKLRLAQKRAADNHHTCRGDAVSLGAGMTVKVANAPDSKIADQEYLCVRAQHSVDVGAYATGGGHVGAPYMGAYEFVEVRNPLVPELRTPQSRIRGPQTATVVGEGEIDCDEHGRILVKFHWDRDGAQSMRCRVAQIWAGKGWGGMTIPRVGMEVVVIFIDGDPDAPMVVGCVYNGNNKPPYELPGNKNLAGIKSASTPGSGGYNEIVFDDTDGKELFRQHAQYDMETKVLNDERRDVLKNRTTRIVKNDKLEVGDDLTTEVGKKESRQVGNDRSTQIAGKDTLQVGQTLEITAGTSIKLSVGTSSIEMDATGVTIKAASIAVKSMGDLTLTGTMSDLKAAGIVTIKGGMVMIN